MNNLGKYLILLGTVGMAGLCSIVDNAQANVSSDELYSESIYITKSSAEVPTSLESSARSEDAELASNEVSAPAEDSASDVVAAATPAPKKVSKHKKKQTSSPN